ncbi:cation diffusion facilitator family transporter [Indiicoccus explosivorum]|uniref:cation diffusion facilitator family transporter n=1 Tax=Indiicoccus explosivorum TaxID=1917864 RepID=UPI000B443C62|nr:cation diffusion facilitator family transporter [Indiicoccus explosivorum]
MSGHHHHGTQREANRKGLTIALAITVGIMVLEFFGGLFTNSLALLSDSGHMLSDASSIALSLAAIWFAGRAASPNKTYGYYRFEILAALFNGVTLFIMAGFIIYEAFERLSEPPEVAGAAMLGIAAIGLAANLLSAWSLQRKSDVKDNINLKSAYLHILGDALGSVGAIVAGILMITLEWYIADPIISVLVSLLILRSAWGVLWESVNILMEGAPATIDPEEITRLLGGISGVEDVHDLHVWTVTSGIDSFTCHLLVIPDADEQRVLEEAVGIMRSEFKIEHTTIQVEKKRFQHTDLPV